MGEKDTVSTSANMNSELNSNGGEALMSWEKKLESEPPKAFKAFCLFRAMGYKRSIKACMEMHGIEPKKYGSWARYARLYRWNERAAEYDAYIAKETEREILAERVERRKRQMEMLNGFDELVQKRIKTLKPEDLNADGAMDLLERSAKLDSFITGADKEAAKQPVQGELAISFVDSFKDL
ncbi:hypothetical protein [Treponema bryantii]|uniref:hypothetical protein n=1 Tax=Treponema bryantii TaxID=163 RepID=UPI002B31BEEC|nr:hypothetical protein TRBR_14390 [Treponema bryantii]